MKSIGTYLPALLCAALLAACGGGGSNAPTGTQNLTPLRGALMQSPPPRTASLTVSDFTAMLNSNSTGQQLVALAGAPKCGVDVQYLQYGTVGGANEKTTASAVLMVPTGSNSACTDARPIVEYAHGTNITRSYNLANLTDPSNAAYNEAVSLAAIYAAQGYIVVAPNYAGYDSSPLPYHPYLNADQQSKDMIDALAAAKAALPTLITPVTTNGRLFITGYSQGGHVAMATQRAMQNLGIPVTGAAPLSGPYALAAQADATFYGMVDAGGTVFFPMIFTSYQMAYGGLYSQPTDIYNAVYASGIAGLLPGNYNFTTVISSGKLPQSALFSSTPPAPQYASLTPIVTSTALDPLFALGVDPTNYLINNTTRGAYLADAINHPDGVVNAFLAATNYMPATNAGNALRIAAIKNDLRLGLSPSPTWTPTSPTLLCGGNGDPTVFFSLNSQVMAGLWAANTNVSLLDVDSLSS